MFKKEVVEQHEKGFLKTVKQVDFFTEGLDLCLFDPFKDVKDDQLLDKEEIVVGEEDDDGEDNEANVQAVFPFTFLYFFGFMVVLALKL